MWTPPSPSPSTSSTPLSSRSQSSSQLEGEAEDDIRHEDSPSQQHAYPPRRQSHADVSHRKPVNYGTLGEFTKAWRIVIPPEAVQKGAKSTMVFKNWKIWWAVEAVISHRPQGIHGDRIIKSHQLALLSYAPRCTSAKAPEWTSSPLTNHPLAYSITTSSSTFGSSDPIEFHIQLSKRSSLAETPKKVSLELRREILFGPSTSSESPTSSTHGQSSEPTSLQNQNKKRVAHSRSNSGNLLNLLPTSSSSRQKSESQEALIVTTPPPLSHTSSTISSFSTTMPSTPPAFSPSYEKLATTPAEYAESTNSGSYFGLFNGGASRKSSIGDLSSKQSKYPTQNAQPLPAPPSVILSAPPQSSSAKRQASSSSKKEDLALTTFEVDCTFTSPNWNGKIIGNMPRVKSLYHYALGETCQTPSQSTTINPHARASSSNMSLVPTGAGGASSRFYLVPRIHFKNKNSFIDLPPVDILFYTVSEEDRKKATELIPKISAIQKAEARLFGGEEITPKADQHGKQSTSKTLSHATSAHHLARQAQKASTSLPTARPRTSQSVSPKVGTGKSSHPLPALQLPEPVKLDEDTVRLSTVRRRSEQHEDFLDNPRTRQRFASISDLSPVVGSPYIDAVSPSLSVISSSTTRPRSAARSRPTTANSARSNSSRPRSSAGLGSTTPLTSGWNATSDAFIYSDPGADGGADIDMSHSPSPSSLGASIVPPALDSASSTSARTSSGSDSSTDASPRSTSSPEHHGPSTKSSTKTYSYGPGPVTSASVNGLFADFSGFSLRPPESIVGQIPLIREELVAPKATKPYSQSPYRQEKVVLPKTTSSSTSNKRKSTEILNAPGPAKMAPSKSASGSTISSSSSSLVFLHEVTLAAPPVSALMNPNSVSRDSLRSSKPRSSTMGEGSSPGANRDTLSPLIDSSTPPHSSASNSRRAKGGMSGAFSFFRRSSARI